MSQQNSTPKWKIDWRLVGKARTCGKCKTCGGDIPKGSQTWWSATRGWECMTCRPAPTETPIKLPANPAARELPRPIYSVRLVKEGTVKSRDAINSSEEARAVAAEVLADSPNERLLALLLNTKHRLLGVVEITSGTLNASLVHPREVFRPAILANAAAIIVAHNHPSGDLTPSREDWGVFHKLRRAGQEIGIDCLDSVIVNDEREGISMAEMGGQQ